MESGVEGKIATYKPKKISWRRKWYGRIYHSKDDSSFRSLVHFDIIPIPSEWSRLIPYELNQ